MKKKYNLYNGDCLTIMDNLIKQNIKVDAIITDPPYGTTACKWDTIIPFDKMWERINKLYNSGASCLLFGNEPFSTKLRESNFDNYRYDIYWVKTKPSLYQHAKNRPMKKIELISVFSNCKWGHKSQVKNRMNYYPQGVKSNGEKIVTKNYNAGKTVGKRPNQLGKKYESFTGFPTDVLFFQNVIGKKAIHPTQKPVELMEYLIKTYTNENEIVLDFTMGSGSTGIAALKNNRKFIGIELDTKYFNIAKNRIENFKYQQKTIINNSIFTI